MSTFDELLALLRDGPAEEGGVLPDTIYDDLNEAYLAAVDGANATIAARESAIAERDMEISRLKSANYDLLTRTESEPEPEPEPESPDEEKGIDSLFGED